jgi:polyhydroxybutyrate depolymerase
MRWVTSLCVLGVASSLVTTACATVGGAIEVGGRARTYRLHLPANAPRGPVPLVIALHGGFGNGKQMEKSVGFDAVADREGFAVVYPDGLNHHWNDGRTASGAEDVDDVAFMRALIDELVAKHGIDGKRVFATGVSNGGSMSYRLACELSDRIVAIAPVIGALSVGEAAACHPTRPISVLAIASVNDPLVPYNGGEIDGASGRPTRGAMIGAIASATQLATAAGCTGAPTTTAEPDRDPNDGTTVERRDYSGCPAGIAVTLVSITGSGHTWPGSHGRELRITGKTSQEFSATERIWQFFAAHGGTAR